VQPLVADPRSTLTDAQVVALIQDAPALTVSAGLELLDMTLAVQADMSDGLVGGSVSRASYASLHGTATLNLSVELDWGTAIVRPYIVLTDGVIAARFNLGAYFTSTPHHDLDTVPSMFAVSGYDILYALSSPVGEVYAVDVGIAYLTAVESILTGQGFVAGTYLIDQASVATVLPSARVWPIDERTTWLTVVNDLLGAIGYAGIWSDWDGRLHCEPYANPRDRGPEWFYDVDTATSMLTLKRTIERDFFAAPNRWVGVRSNNVDGIAPVEGAGVYTVVNAHDGPTSTEARGGRVISRILSLDVADQASLIALVEQTVDADLRLKTTLTLGTSPNPLHWHFDRVVVNDPAIGSFVDVLVTDWTLPLDGGDMQHSWTLLT
jgi:hypothetical protein